MKSKQFAQNWYEGAPNTEDTELRINGLSGQFEKFRVQTQDDIAAWFENCGMEELTNQQVAKIIRKWQPSAQQGIARELLRSDGFVDDFDHEQLGMLPKDAIPQSREF